MLTRLNISLSAFLPSLTGLHFVLHMKALCLLGIDTLLFALFVDTYLSRQEHFKIIS